MARTLNCLLTAGFLIALAGCTDTGEDANRALDAGSYTITTSGVPGTVPGGQTFSFELSAQGTPGASSDHIGAHYWAEIPNDPTAELSNARGCDHQEAETPGSYTITCTIDEAGEWHLYGHLRLVEDGVQHDYWGPSHTITVQSDAI